MNIVILYNPVAGSGRSEDSARRLESPLAAAGHSVQCRPTELGPTEQWLDPILADAQVLVVVGGDGAMRLAAPAVVRTKVPVYHFPMGTENLFAREFSAWKSVDGLVAALDAMQVQSIDVGYANGRIFLVMASLGFDAEVVDDLARHRSGGISHLSYAGPIARQLARWRPPTLTVRVDGETIVDAQPGMFVVANVRQYGMRLDPVAWADPADGQFDVVFMPANSRAAVLRWTVACRLGRQRKRRDLVMGAGRCIEVERCGARFQLDGDSPGGLPDGGPDGGPGDWPDGDDSRDGLIRFTIVPAALPVLTRSSG